MKSVATGLTCVALVAVLATWSLGDGQSPTEPLEVELAVEGRLEEFPLLVLDGLDVAPGEVPQELPTRDRQTVILGEGAQARVSVIGEGAELPAAVSGEQVQTFAFVLDDGVEDKAAQASLDKLADQLAGQADALEKEGKQAEAQAKRTASKAIRGLLEKGTLQGLPLGKGAGGKMRVDVRVVGRDGPGSDVVRRVVRAQVHAKSPMGRDFVELHQHLEALQKKLSDVEGKLTGEALEQASHALRAEIEAVEAKIAAKQDELKAAVVPPGMPARVHFPAGGPLPRVMMLRSQAGGAHQQALVAQADALLKASQAMKAAGKHEEAKRLMDESENLRTHASHLADHMLHVDPLHQPAFAPQAPLHEVRTSLKELQEQIQALRKEVAELKDLLKK